MASGALFGSAATGSRSGSKNLVEFRAGKMHLKGTTVTPDKRKGLVYVHQSEDSLVHFCWKDRTSGSVEDDLIIFPDDCEFKRVPQCTTGRVYILKFKSSSRKFFFWMQEPKTEKDEEYCKKVNEYLNNPPPPGSSSGSRSGGLPPELAALGGQLGGEGSLGMLGNMDQQQLMQLLGGGGLSALGGMGGLGGLGALIGEGRPSSAQSTSSSVPSRVQSSPGQRPSSGSGGGGGSSSGTTGTAAATGTGTSGTNLSSQRPATASGALPSQSPARQQIQLSDLQNILGSMNIPAAESGNQGDQAQTAAIDLSQTLSPEVMAPILSNPEVQQRLMQHLPEGESLPRDPEQLSATLHSPQFQQAMNMFGAALQSGQLGPLMNQFGLSQEAVEAANRGDLPAFVRGMQSEGGQDKKEDKDKPSGGDEKDKDDDEGMSVD